MHISCNVETKLENSILVSQFLMEDYHKAYQLDTDGKSVW